MQRSSMHGEWSSKWTFILAATGAAVGLGNIWKFPYVAGQNGGSAFVIVYLICIFLVGIPVMMAEIAIGRNGRRNPATSMQTMAQESNLSKQWRWVGGMTILAGFLILTYYSVVAGWALAYVYKSLIGAFQHATPASIETSFASLVTNPTKLAFWHTVIMATTGYVIARGIEEGIERAVRIMFPAMLILLFILVIYGIESGYFMTTIHYLFNPDFSKLTPHIMVVALGQAFFSLSVATGSIMMYGAYLPKKISIANSAVTIAFADTFVALLAGLAIFPIVFANGLTPADGPGLIFKTLPLAFSQMPYGLVFSVLFFIMLVFAAFTSTLSLLEPTVAWLVETRGISRKRAAILSASVIWVIGFGTVFSFNHWDEYRLFGLNFFQIIDYLTANIMLPLGGLLVSIFAVWCLRKEHVSEELALTNKKLFTSWRFAMRYVTPLAILLIFANAIVS